jgi:hypothetical protein
VTRNRKVKSQTGAGRGRRVLLAMLVAAGLLVAVLVVLNLVVSSRARRLKNSITVDNGATAIEAGRAAAGFKNYLAAGARGDHTLDGPGLTRFIAGRYGDQVPRSVGAWRITLREGKTVVGGVVDLEAYLREMGMEQPATLSGFASQDIPFSFRGRLEANQSRGRFTVEEVSLLGLTLPLDLVQRVAESGGGARDSVLVQQFALPGGITGASIEDDRMVIHGQGP